MGSAASYLYWIRSASYFLIRSGRSSFALGLMVIAAISTLIFLSSLAVGVNDAMVRNSVGLYSGHIIATGLPSSLSPEVLKMNGTTHVLKRMHVPGLVSVGAGVEAIDMICIDAASEEKATAFTKKIVQGSNVRNGSHDVLLSAPAAERLGLSVGDTVRFSSKGIEGPVELKVSGLFKTGIASMDMGTAFSSVDAIPLKSRTWDAAVFLSDGFDSESIVSRYKHDLGDRYSFKTWKEFMPDLVQLIELNYLSMNIVIALVFGVVALGVSCAFVVFIFKNLREYGIMKAMGVKSGEIAFLIVMEIVLVNLAACIAGGILGVAATLFFSKSGIDLSAWTSHNQYFVVSGRIFPRLTLYSIISPPLVCLAFGLISAVWPALLVARKKTIDILRVV